MNNTVDIVMYHYVRELRKSRYPGIKGLDYDLFKEQIQFFIKNFNVIKMEQLIRASQGIEKLPEKALLLTFDDGYRDHYDYVFPILDKYKLQGSFFVPTSTFMEGRLLDVNKIHFVLATQDPLTIYRDLLQMIEDYREAGQVLPPLNELIETYAIASRFDVKEVIFIKQMLQTVLPRQLRHEIADQLFDKYMQIDQEVFAHEIYLSKDKIECMKNHGMYIGLHGYGHDWMGNIPFEEATKEIDQAIKDLQGIIDPHSWVMNYPYGSYSQDIIDYARQKGAVLGLATKVQKADISKDDSMALPRLDTNDFPPKSNHYLSFSR